VVYWFNQTQDILLENQTLNDVKWKREAIFGFKLTLANLAAANSIFLRYTFSKSAAVKFGKVLPAITCILWQKMVFGNLNLKLYRQTLNIPEL